MDDKQLINQVLKDKHSFSSNNQKAIKELYKKYSPALFSLISFKVGKREDIEEILQDTWIAILDSLPIFNFRSSFATWAKSIALHEVADFYRRRKIKSIVFSRLPFLENLVSEALGPEMACEQKEVRRDLEKVLVRLNEGYGKILRLKYIEGLSMAQIGRRLNLSIKAVESRLSRARLAFQKEWQRDYRFVSSASLPFLPSKRGI